MNIGFLKDNPGNAWNTVEEEIDGHILNVSNRSFWRYSQRIQKSPPYFDPFGNEEEGQPDCSGWLLDENTDMDNGPICDLRIATQAPLYFMAHKSSWQAVLRDIPSDYYEYGFWGAVEKHTGLNEQQFYDEFNATMRSVDWSTIDSEFAPDGWNIPDEAIETAVDFLNIDQFTIPGCDDDMDGVMDSVDAFPLDASETLDTDSDGTCNNADTDDDGDGVADGVDAFPLISLSGRTDTDDDGYPDDCDEDCLATGMTADSDDDNDGVDDTSDAYPLDASLWSLKVEDVLAEISDENLRACVEAAVIGLVEVADLSDLDCSERGIVNLTGLQNFIGLTKLELRFNQIADLSPLLNLSNLLELGLQGNPIDWLTFPEGLIGIQILRGNGTKLDSTDRIPSYLALTLKDLDISYQNADLMGLAGLSLFSKLERLSFSGNPSIDWSSLPALANVKFLGAHGTGLEYLSQLLPLATNLEHADLSHNSLVSLEFLNRFPEMDSLNVAYNQINDISGLNRPLGGLTLGGNNLVDLSPLSIYQQATQGAIELWGNPIRRIGDLFVGWTNLRVSFESNENQTTGGLACQEIDYVNSYIDSTLYITWPSFSACWDDPDRDYYYESEDAFPNDPAASVDTDGDGMPDDWHEGRSESDSTSDPALVLDDDDDNDGIDDEIEQANGTNPRNADSDGDAVGDNLDNCPSLSNAGQLNTDGDTEGDVCDSDDDNDGFSDEEAIDDTNPLNRFSCRTGCFSFDVDENLEAQPLTDGLLVIRHLFGFSGDSLTSGAVSGEANRGSSEAIAGYLTDADSELDIDGDGESKPLTDGLLLIRYLFGFSGDSLISGAIGDGAERDTAEEVEAYIAERVPVQ